MGVVTCEHNCRIISGWTDTFIHIPTEKGRYLRGHRVQKGGRVRVAFIVCDRKSKQTHLFLSESFLDGVIHSLGTLQRKRGSCMGNVCGTGLYRGRTGEVGREDGV